MEEANRPIDEGSSIFDDEESWHDRLAAYDSCRQAEALIPGPMDAGR